jgi:hypothetical protein
VVRIASERSLQSEGLTVPAGEFKQLMEVPNEQRSHERSAFISSQQRRAPTRRTAETEFGVGTLGKAPLGDDVPIFYDIRASRCEDGVASDDSGGARMTGSALDSEFKPFGGGVLLFFEDFSRGASRRRERCGRSNYVKSNQNVSNVPPSHKGSFVAETTYSRKWRTRRGCGRSCYGDESDNREDGTVPTDSTSHCAPFIYYRELTLPPPFSNSRLSGRC